MKELRIKDICDKGSSNLKQKDVEGKTGRYPVYGASGIISHIDSYHQEENYIAIVKDGSGIGRVTFMPAKSSVIGTMQYILPKEGFNINYIGYCLQSLDLSKYKQGAAIPHIYFRDYGERIVNVTEEINEQQRIVDYLDSVFAKIDAVKANAEKALNEAKALFQASLKEMLEPKEGWEEKKIGDICKINSGKSIKASFIRDKGIYHNIPCYGGNGLRGYVSTPNQVGGNPIIGRVGAQCGNIHYCDEPFYATEHALVVTLKDDNVNPQWLCRKFESMKLGTYAEGAAQPVIAASKLLQLEITVPPLSEQQRIVDYLDSAFAKIDAVKANAEKALNECDALKQAILKQVFE